MYDTKMLPKHKNNSVKGRQNPRLISNKGKRDKEETTNTAESSVEERDEVDQSDSDMEDEADTTLIQIDNQTLKKDMMKDKANMEGDGTATVSETLETINKKEKNHSKSTK